MSYLELQHQEFKSVCICICHQVKGMECTRCELCACKKPDEKIDSAIWVLVNERLKQYRQDQAEKNNHVRAKLEHYVIIFERILKRLERIEDELEGIKQYGNHGPTL